MASQASKRRITVGRALLVPVGAAVALLVAAVAVAAPHGSQADRVRAIEHARLQALVAGDTAIASRYIADDFELVTPTGDLTTRDDYLGIVEAGIVDYLAPNDYDLFFQSLLPAD
jgi:hypothetical protein